MAFDENKAFEVTEDGIVIGSVLLTSGSNSPVGSSAPENSFYYRTNGELWKKFGSGDNDWRRFSGQDVFLDNSQIGSSDVLEELKVAKRIYMSFGDLNDDYCQNLLGVYKVMRNFTFCGTTMTGIPNCFKVVASMKLANRTGRVRLYDVTNAKEICQVDITSTTKDIYDMGTISNLPSSGALFEIQGREVDGGTLRIYAFTMGYV